MAIVDLLLSLLYPPRCTACARDLTARRATGLCRRCCSELGEIGPACPRCGEPGTVEPCARCRRAPPPFGRARACVLYRDDALSSRLILRWKDGGDHLVGSSLGRLLADHRKRHDECYDLVVPVPSHASRLVQRGFNQAALLAHAAVRPGERVLVDVLCRTSGSVRQAALGRAARAANVRDAFVTGARHDVRGRHVLLIDDVVTTGATVRACTAALLEAGAAGVDVWSVARTPPPGWRADLAARPAAAAHGAR